MESIYDEYSVTEDDNEIIYRRYHGQVDRNFALRIVGRAYPRIGTKNLAQPKNMQDKSINVFPVPANTEINIEAPIDVVLDKVILIDLTGRIMISQSINISSSNELVSLDISSVSSGVYFLQIHSSNRTIVNKIIVSK